MGALGIIGKTAPLILCIFVYLFVYVFVYVFVCLLVRSLLGEYAEKLCKWHNGNIIKRISEHNLALILYRNGLKLRELNGKG